MTHSTFINKEEMRERAQGLDLGVLDHVIELNARLPYVAKDYPDSFGNVFIFGLQRSGTTLASQLIAGATDLGYINNLIARFWENPAYGVFLSRHLGLDRKIAFQSTHGTTEGITNVHEFGYFWTSLFQTDSTPSLAEINPANVNWDLVKNKLLSINHAFGKPCVYKNTLVGHFLPQLQALLRSKLFVFVKRDFLEIAVSTWKVRQQRYGHAGHWWSMKPRQFEALKDLEPHEQIVAQIHYLYEDLVKQTALVPRDNLVEVHYRDLCADPSGFLTELQGRAARQQIHFSVLAKNIEPFDQSTIKDNDADVRKFQQLLASYGLPFGCAA
jgi:Sulfotransferase family